MNSKAGRVFRAGQWGDERKRPFGLAPFPGYEGPPKDRHNAGTKLNAMGIPACRRGMNIDRQQVLTQRPSLDGYGIERAGAPAASLSASCSVAMLVSTVSKGGMSPKIIPDMAA